MPTMGSYCKAYPLMKLREFKGWAEKPINLESEQTEQESAESFRYLYLQENLTVTDGIFLDENIVFDQVTGEWEDFCRNQLKFEVPDFEREHNESLLRRTPVEGGVQ